MSRANYISYPITDPLIWLIQRIPNEKILLTWFAWRNYSFSTKLDYRALLSMWSGIRLFIFELLKDNHQIHCSNNNNNNNKVSPYYHTLKPFHQLTTALFTDWISNSIPINTIQISKRASVFIVVNFCRE